MKVQMSSGVMLRIARGWLGLGLAGFTLLCSAEATGASALDTAQSFYDTLLTTKRRGNKADRRCILERHVRLLRRDQVTSWAELADACGYADQAHLTRGFRALAGTPPASFMRRKLPDQGGFVD